MPDSESYEQDSFEIFIEDLKPPVEFRPNGGLSFEDVFSVKDSQICTPEVGRGSVEYLDPPVEWSGSANHSLADIFSGQGSRSRSLVFVQQEKMTRKNAERGKD